VVNVAVSGYRLHQQLALLQSRLRRYRPDRVLLMDGYNNSIHLYNWARRGHPGDFHVYENTPGREEFDTLANPSSLKSLVLVTEAWLGARSSAVSVLLRRIPGRVRNG
jgi:hypothetical protein